jgi:hypothetical protein
MNAFESFELYLSLKFHFTQKKYDYFRFNGKVKTTVAAFEKRNDQRFFHRLAKNYSLKKATELFVSNFVYNPSIWVGDLVGEEAEQIYAEWQGRIEGITYHFNEDCEGILGWLERKQYKFNDLFTVKDNDHPIIVKMALQKTISLETFVILDRILQFGSRVDKKLDDVIWKDFWFRVTKYDPFLTIDLPKHKKLLREKIENDYPLLK